MWAALLSLVCFGCWSMAQDLSPPDSILNKLSFEPETFPVNNQPREAFTQRGNSPDRFAQPNDGRQQRRSYTPQGSQGFDPRSEGPREGFVHPHLNNERGARELPHRVPEPFGRRGPFGDSQNSPEHSTEYNPYRPRDNHFTQSERTNLPPRNLFGNRYLARPVETDSRPRYSVHQAPSSLAPIHHEDPAFGERSSLGERYHPKKVSPRSSHEGPLRRVPNIKPIGGFDSLADSILTGTPSHLLDPEVVDTGTGSIESSTTNRKLSNDQFAPGYPRQINPNPQYNTGRSPPREPQYQGKQDVPTDSRLFPSEGHNSRSTSPLLPIPQFGVPLGPPKPIVPLHDQSNEQRRDPTYDNPNDLEVRPFDAREERHWQFNPARDSHQPSHYPGAPSGVHQGQRNYQPVQPFRYPPGGHGVLADQPNEQYSLLGHGGQAEQPNQQHLPVGPGSEPDQLNQQYLPVGSAGQVDQPNPSGVGHEPYSPVYTPPRGPQGHQFSSPTGQQVQQYTSPTAQQGPQFAPPTGQQGSQFTPPTGHQGQQYTPPIGLQEPQYTPPTGQQGPQYAPPTGQQGQQYAPPTGQEGQQYTPPTAQQGQQYTPPTAQQGQQYAPPTGQQGPQYTPPTAQQGQQYTPPTAQQGQQYTPPTGQQGQQYTPPTAQQGQQYTPPTAQQGQQYTPPTAQQGHEFIPAEVHQERKQLFPESHEQQYPSQESRGQYQDQGPNPVSQPGRTRGSFQSPDTNQDQTHKEYPSSGSSIEEPYNSASPEQTVNTAPNLHESDAGPPRKVRVSPDQTDTYLPDDSHSATPNTAQAKPETLIDPSVLSPVHREERVPVNTGTPESSGLAVPSTHQENRHSDVVQPTVANAGLGPRSVHENPTAHKQAVPTPGTQVPVPSGGAVKQTVPDALAALNPSNTHFVPPGLQGQCYKYMDLSAGYSPSDDSFEYPDAAISAEIREKTFLAPILGFKNFAQPASQFGLIPFGNLKGNNNQNINDYLYSSNVYPTGYKEGDFKMATPSDYTCRSTQSTLRMFKLYGGRCWTVNPDYQRVSYKTCGAPGLHCGSCSNSSNTSEGRCSADYEWVKVWGYCEKATPGQRIRQLRLYLPTGCSCKKYYC